jgi:hypothetical protein
VVDYLVMVVAVVTLNGGVGCGGGGGGGGGGGVEEAKGEGGRERLGESCRGWIGLDSNLFQFHFHFGRFVSFYGVYSVPTRTHH